MIVSVFDCDGTLFSAHFGRGLLEYTHSQGFNDRVRRYYLTLLTPYLLRKLRLIKKERLNRPAIANLSGLMQGWDLQEAADAYQWITQEYLLPTVHPEVIARLKDHQAQGHRVILLTGIFKPCLDLIGTHFDVSDLVGTVVDVIDGRYTGKIIPPVVTGRDKLPMLCQYCEAQGMQIDWQSSYAYADSIYDRDVLEKVGHPAAVHPDAGLAALASEKGWEVIDGK